MIIAYINNKEMDQKYDDDILVSIRSQQSSQDQKQQTNKAKQPQTYNNKVYEDQQQEFQIKQSIRIGGNAESNKKPIVQIKKQKQVVSSDSDFNNDTDQIIKTMKNKNIKTEQANKKQVKILQQKNNKKQYSNSPSSKEIKYPQIKQLQQRVSNKKQIENNIIKKQIQIPNSRFNGINLQQNQQIDINVSMIGDRTTKIKNIIQKQKSIKQKQTKIQQKNIDQKVLKNQPNPYESIYLSNGRPQPKKNQVQYKVMDKTMYWAFGGKQLKISFQVLQNLVQNFFKKQVMLPLVSDAQFKSDHIILYMQIYTDFLNYFFKQLFIQIFSALKNSSLFGSKAQIGLSVTSPKHSQSINKFPYYDYISKYFKSSNYSKAEFLRNYMVLKCNSMRLFEQILEQKHQNCHQNQRKYLQNEISMLQLFVSFQNAQSYCKENSKQGIDHKIWKQHGKKLNELRKNWILKIEGQKHDFSFLI